MQNSRMQCQVINFHQSLRQEQQRRTLLQNEHNQLTQIHHQLKQQQIQTNQANNILTQQLRVLQLQLDTLNATNGSLQRKIQQQKDETHQLKLQLQLMQSNNNENQKRCNVNQFTSLNTGAYLKCSLQLNAKPIDYKKLQQLNNQTECHRQQVYQQRSRSITLGSSVRSSDDSSNTLDTLSMSTSY